MAVFAVAVNGLLFFSLSWMNKLPRNTPTRRPFSAIEVFPVELPPAPPLPVIQAMPTVTETTAPRTEADTTESAYEPAEFAPRMANWAPQLPLVQVPLTLRAVEVAPPPKTLPTPIAKSSGPLQLFQVDQVPKKISGRLPAYPYWARTQGAEGIVVLRFVVITNGTVGKIEIDRVEGDGRFAEAAKEAVAKWVFSPARYNAKPVAVWCVQRIQFRLD